MEYADCGCEFMHDSLTRVITTKPCPEHSFNLPEWEARLA
jgi:hypothetical protein